VGEFCNISEAGSDESSEMQSRGVCAGHGRSGSSSDAAALRVLMPDQASPCSQATIRHQQISPSAQGTRVQACYQRLNSHMTSFPYITRLPSKAGRWNLSVIEGMERMESLRIGCRRIERGFRSSALPVNPSSGSHHKQSCAYSQPHLDDCAADGHQCNLFKAAY